MLAYTYVSILFVSFLTSLVSLAKGCPRHFRVFSVILGVTFLVEFFCFFLVRPFHVKNTMPVYNVYLLFAFTGYAYYYQLIMVSRQVQKAIRIFLVLFPVFWLVTTFFVFAINIWNSYVVVAGSLFTIAMSIAYYQQLFVSKKLIRLHKSPEFWIATAFIFYYACQLPIMGVLNFLGSNYRLLAQKLIIFQNVLNIILYSIFIYAFLCLKTSIKKS